MQRAGMFILHALGYLVLFPLIVIFWFLAIVILLIFLSEKPESPLLILAHIESVFLVSIALVTAIRITAYYTEDLSKDLAKMLPFALLGVFIVNSTWVSIPASLEMLELITVTHSLIEKVVYYCLFVVLLEFVLRGFNSVRKRVFPKKKKEIPEESSA